MWIVNRKEGEKVIVVAPSGERITIEVQAVQGGRAKLALSAPQAFRFIHKVEPEPEVCAYCGDEVDTEAPTFSRDVQTGWPQCQWCAGEA